MTGKTDAVLKRAEEYIRTLEKPTLSGLLRRAKEDGKLLYQPRCGVGGHREMEACLVQLEELAGPEVLSLTIDSHTRLKDFRTAREILETDPAKLNGYPLVAHGHHRGRELNRRVSAPLQIRHGSPDPRRLFDVSVLSGITAFEGGPISYNLPYSKNFPLEDSLAAWEYVDTLCGAFETRGISIDRELFGTLTGVLVPPSVSLAVSVLEAMLAAARGVRCISIAYPQGGEIVQDVAALRCIDLVARKYLPGDVAIYPVLHEYMGPFPRDSVRADSLIFYGALTARIGKATKIVTKTNHEAYGIPTVSANAEGIRTARMAEASFLDFIEVDGERVEEEAYWIQREVDEILFPVLQSADLATAIVDGFRAGHLDIPFSAARQARSEILPLRDRSGAIRYQGAGALNFSDSVKARNRELLGGKVRRANVFEEMLASINHFANDMSHNNETTKGVLR